MNLERPISDHELRMLPFPLRQRFFVERPSLAHVLEEYGHLMPVTTATFNALPQVLRRYYHANRLTELAARVLLEQAAKSSRGGMRSCYGLKKSPNRVGRHPLLRPENYRWEEDDATSGTTNESDTRAA